MNKLLNSNLRSYVIYGIVRSERAKTGQLFVGNQEIKYSILRRPPIMCAVTRVDEENPTLTLSGFKYFRRFCIQLSKRISLAVFGKWRAIRIEFQLEEEHFPEIYFIDKSANQNVLISRDVIRLGFRFNRLDIGLDYEFARNLNQYEIYLSWGYVEINGIKIPGKGESPGYSDCLKKTYFAEYFKVPSSKTIERSLMTGPFEKIGNSSFLADPRYLERWSKLEVLNGSILHGQNLIDNSAVYILDRSRVPERNLKAINWPSYLSSFEPQFATLNIEQEKLSQYNEVIFLGGINNYMHFVLEIMPRMYFIAHSDLDISIPIVVYGALSNQIKETLECLTKRTIVHAMDNTTLSAAKVHAFEFDSPLFDAMSGNDNVMHQLGSVEVYNWAKKTIFESHQISTGGPKRIFIRREKNLFRPLINGDALSRILQSQFNFDEHYVGGLSLGEVINIFSGAEIIVAEYGAALGNLCFVSNPGNVIELRGELEKNSIEYQLYIQILGHQHVSIIGSGKSISRYGFHRGPYKISERQLIRAVEGFSRTQMA